MDNEKTFFIKFDSSREHYSAQACIFWCFDARFSGLYNNFISQRDFSIGQIDLVKGAGGAQPLAGEADADRDVAGSQLMKSIKLHNTERLILMVHIDCGGYGGSKAFDNDHQKEWDHHAAELEKAAKFVHEKFPEIKEVEKWIADFDGLHRIDAVL